MRVLPRSRSGAVLTIVAGALALVVGLFVILATVASYKTVTVERRWADTLGTRDEFFSRYPPTEANAAALELERLSAALGIDMAPRHGEGRAHPDKGVGMSKDQTREMGQWREAHLERSSRGIDPPPAGLSAFIDRYEDELSAIRSHLTRAEVPRWEMHMERAQEAPIPNLLGHINLQKLLVTDALIRVRAGEFQTAEQDLEAGWRLMQSLWDSPILISQLIAIADARMIAAALRQFERPSPGWRARLKEHDFRTAFTDAMRYEGWAWTQFKDTTQSAGLSGVASRLMGSLTKPYWRYCLADASDAWRARLENLDQVPGICDYDLSPYEADMRIDVPRWNVIAGIIVPNLAGAVHRLGRLEFELELTARLLDLELHREKGAWPARLPGVDQSAACPADRWTYEVGADGSATLALDRTPAWPEQKGHRQVAGFRLESPAG